MFFCVKINSVSNIFLTSNSIFTAKKKMVGKLDWFAKSKKLFQHVLIQMNDFMSCKSRYFVLRFSLLVSNSIIVSSLGSSIEKNLSCHISRHENMYTMKKHSYFHLCTCLFMKLSCKISRYPHTIWKFKKHFM